MNEFIVESIRDKCILPLISINIEEGLLFLDTSSLNDGRNQDLYCFDEVIFHRNIWLKDINGKNIYADSSIVEFTFSLYGISHPKTIGIFTYSTLQLCYLIEFTADGKDWSFPYTPVNVQSIKIIDTKLGLIK